MSGEAKGTARPAHRPDPILGHGYCWAEHQGTHLRCTRPKGHSGKHEHEYTPRTEW